MFWYSLDEVKGFIAERGRRLVVCPHCSSWWRRYVRGRLFPLEPVPIPAQILQQVDQR